MKPLVWIGMFVGSTIGGAIPLMWGGSEFSISSLFLSGVGAIVGIWAGFTIGRNF